MKKLISYIRWFSIAILLQLIIIPLSYIVYPVSYVFRKGLRKWYYSGNRLKKVLSIPLWIFLDDEVVKLAGDDYGENWWKTVNNIKISELGSWQRFKVAYRWGVIRNPAWNQYSLIRPIQGNKKIVSEKGNLKRGNIEVSLLNFAVFKYVNLDGEYTDNQGDFLSLKYSILGWSKVWYEIEDMLYWRYSMAKQYGKYWIEIQLGTNDNRYTIRFKIKKNLKVYESKKLF